MLDSADLVPKSYLKAYQRIDIPPADAGSPLPDIAFHHYTHGGCWILAVALHYATGFPIEIHWRDEKPRHAYVCDGLRAIDARGVGPIERARAGADYVGQVTVSELQGYLQGQGEDGALINKDMTRRESQFRAEQAAAAILASMDGTASN